MAGGMSVGGGGTSVGVAYISLGGDFGLSLVDGQQGWDLWGGGQT